MTQTATPSLGFQNKFSTTLSSGVTSTDTTIPLTTLPTPTEGFLVLEPDSATAWEVIYYTSKTGSAVVCPSVGAGRGQDDSTAQSHSSGATVRMDTTAGMFEVLQNGSSMAVGSIVQVVNTTSSAVATGTTAIPNDDTIPQITEGTEFITQSITPRATTNILVIQINAVMAVAAASNIIGALFQDATANALAATSTNAATINSLVPLTLTYTMAAGTTSSTTFRFRAGNAAGNTVTWNGEAATRRFGAIAKSSIVIHEYNA